MCTYKVKVKLIGRMTQLPDSQKIFGALMYRYAEYNAEKVTVFTKEIREGKTQCNISNLLPTGCLPVPETYLNDLVSTFIKEDSKTIYKEIKKRHFIEKKLLEQILRMPLQAKDVYPYVCVEKSQDIHASIESIRLNIPGLDPNLYSVPNETLVRVDKAETKDKSEKKTPISEFEFLLAIENDSVRNDILEILHEMKHNHEPLILGPRASQGMNMYSITGYEEEQLPQFKEYYLNIGMMLPNQINYTKSALTCYTSERKPYKHWSGYGEGYENQYITFLKAGSIIALDEDKRSASKSLQSPFDEKAIVFGNSFLLSIPLEHGGQEDDAKI